MVTRSQADELVRSNEEIRRLVERSLDGIVEYLAGRPNLTPEQFRNSLIAEVDSVVYRFGQVAGAVAAEWYDDIRASQAVSGSYRAQVAASPYGEDAVEGMVRRALGSFFQDTPDLAETMRAIQSSAGKYVAGASRSTIQLNSFRDPRADGWRRVARGHTCDFCLMLVGRGAVYRRESAFFASHGHCDCAAVPSFDPSAPEVEVDVYRASVRTTGMSEAQRAAHNNLIRDYIESHQVELADIRADI